MKTQLLAVLGWLATVMLAVVLVLAHIGPAAAQDGPVAPPPVSTRTPSNGTNVELRSMDTGQPISTIGQGEELQIVLWNHSPSTGYYICLDGVAIPQSPVTTDAIGNALIPAYRISRATSAGLHTFSSSDTADCTTRRASASIQVLPTAHPTLVLNDAPHSAHGWPDNSLLPMFIQDHDPNTGYQVYFNGQPLGNGQGGSTCIIHTQEDGTGSGVCGLPDDTQFSQFGVSFNNTYPLTTSLTSEAASYHQIRIVQPQLLIPGGSNLPDTSLITLVLRNHAPGHRYHVFFGQGTSFTEIDGSYPNGVRVDSQGNAFVSFYIPAYTSGLVSLHSQDANTPSPPSSSRQIATGIITVTITPPFITVEGGYTWPAGEFIRLRLRRHSPNTAYDLKFDTGYIDGDPSASGINPVYTDAAGNAFNISYVIPITMEGTKILTSFLATTGRYSATRQLTVVPGPSIEINGDNRYRPGDTITVTLRNHTPITAYDVYLDGTLIRPDLIVDNFGNRTFPYVIPADISPGGLDHEHAHWLESRHNSNPVATTSLFIVAETNQRHYLPVILK